MPLLEDAKIEQAVYLNLRPTVLALVLMPHVAPMVWAQVPRFDQLMEGLLKKFSIPGGQFTCVKQGRFIHNRGYGFADVERKRHVQPKSLFRIGSVSKTITQVAVMTLVERGDLRLDDKAFEILKSLKPLEGSTLDPRLEEITVRHLLKHQGGWDGIEPMFPPWSRTAAATIGTPEPPKCETIIRYMMGKPLSYAPGSRTVYSNFGYCVLGRIIERVSGKPYEEYVQEAVLKPAGIRDMRIGGTRLRELARREVRYYHQFNQTELPYKTESVFPGEGEVPWAYGGYYLRATDAHGGWIGSAADIARLAASIDGQVGRPLLSPASRYTLMNLPKKAGAEEPETTPFHLSHAGALQGSNAALLYRTRDGWSIGITFNSLPVDYQAFFAHLLDEVDRSLSELSTNHQAK